MKTMKKIVAILAVAVLLCSVLPLSVFAAEETATITFDDKAKRTSYTTALQVWEENGITITNNKAASTTNVGDYAKPARFYANSELIIEYPGMTKIEFDCNSGSYATALKNSIGADATVNSDKVTVELDGVDSYTIAKLTAQVRMDAITVYYGGNASADCDHDSLSCGDACPSCDYVKEHSFANNCAATCANCNEANPNYADHVYDGAYDAFCNVCGAEREISFPEAGSVLTIPEADTIGLGMTHNTTTPGKYYVTGVVESIANTTYGNLYIVDEDGNKLYIYGTYSADGSTRFDAMVEKPEVGMTITVYGVIGNYSNASQMKNAWITEMIGGCDHEYEFDCSKSCALCGLELRPEAECVNGSYACQDGLCIYCGGDVDAVEHAFDDQWDPDCNYGCGETREVEERPELTEAIIDFSTTDLRTEYSTSAQKWENGGLVILNEKAGSTSNVGDYVKPARFYKSTTVTISFPGMTTLIIDATGIGSSYLWAATLDAAGLTYTVEELVYTITFAEPVDSITLTMANQGRANSITAVAAKESEPSCEHEYFTPCEQYCMICGELTNPNASHNIIAVAAKAATCTANGNIAYWYCDACGAAWLDEACTMNTNLKAVILPMGEHTYDDEYDADCNVCGATREVPEKPVDVVYGDANGDGAVNNLDVALLQRFLNNWEVTVNESAADANGDGAVNNLDVALLQRFLNNWEVTLGPV